MTGSNSISLKCYCTSGRISKINSKNTMQDLLMTSYVLSSVRFGKKKYVYINYTK